jgi:hypothetical protein
LRKKSSAELKLIEIYKINEQFYFVLLRSFISIAMRFPLVNNLSGFE